MGSIIVMSVIIINLDKIQQSWEEIHSYEYEKAEVIVEEVPDWTDLLEDEEAIQAAKDVIQRKAWEAELEALESSFEATKAIYEAEEDEYLAAKKKLEQSLGLY